MRPREATRGNWYDRELCHRSARRLRFNEAAGSYPRKRSVQPGLQRLRVRPSFNEAAGSYPRKHRRKRIRFVLLGLRRFNEAAGSYPRKLQQSERAYKQYRQEASMRPREATRGNVVAVTVTKRVTRLQ